MYSNQNIYVFDSGFGGLSILKKLLLKPPNEHYVYFADSKNAPYGNRTKNEIENLVNLNLNFLIKEFKPIKLFVLACNTATVNAYENTVNSFPNIKIIGTKPEILDIFKPNTILNNTSTNIHISYNNKIKCQTNNSKLNILIISTNATKNSDYVNNLINVYSNFININCISLQELVYYIENDMLKSAQCDMYIENSLKKYQYLDYLVLSCTHFPFAMSLIKKHINKNTKIIDNADNTIKNIIKYINKKNESLIQNIPTNNNNLLIIETQITDNRKQIYKKLLNNNNLIFY